MFSLAGPRSREILQALTDDDLSNDALPFGAARCIDVGLGRAWVLRRSFVGELGYEIYPTTDLARHVHEELVREGAPRGLRHAGMLALNHGRLEKGFAHHGHDIAEDDNPLEAGLGFAVAFDKPGGFVGRDALVDLGERGPAARLVNLRVDDATQQEGPFLLRNEPVWRGGELVGHVTSGAWGFRVGASLGMGWVKRAGGVAREWLAEGGFEVEVAGVRHPATLQPSAFYDPAGQRMRG